MTSLALRTAAVVIGINTVVVACASAPRPRTSAAPLGAFGACDDENVEGVAADAFVSRPGAWLKVRSIDVHGASDPTLETTEPFHGLYDVVGGDEAARTQLRGAAVTSLTMHGSIAREIHQAVALTPDVYVHSGGTGDARQVDFAVALTQGDFAFLGHCQQRLMTQPLRDLLGAEASARIRDLVGRTGAEVAAAFATPPATPPSVTILNPETVPAELLERLSVVTFSLASLPESWAGPYTICTKIAQGWNDCIDLANARTASLVADTYFDPQTPTLEVWLANASADLSRPLARLATVDLSRLAAQARLDLSGDALRLVGRLAPTSSPWEAMAGAATSESFDGFTLAPRGH